MIGVPGIKGSGNSNDVDTMFPSSNVMSMSSCPVVVHASASDVDQLTT